MTGDSSVRSGGVVKGWTAAPDDIGPCNGDYIIRDAHGRLIALIYCGIGNSGKQAARFRAEQFIAAVSPAWCSTCGADTPGTNECAKCSQWWTENAPQEPDLFAALQKGNPNV